MSYYRDNFSFLQYRRRYNLNNRSYLLFKFIVRKITMDKRSRLYEKRIDYDSYEYYSSILISKLILLYNYFFNRFALCACFQSSEERRHLKRIVDALRDENTLFVQSREREEENVYVLAQRNRRKFIEARSINYQRRTFRDRNREPRSISTRNFSTIRLTRIVEKRRIANRRLKSDTRRLFLFHRTTEVRLLGDAEGRRSFLVSRRVSRGQEEGEEGGEENGRGPVRHS